MKRTLIILGCFVLAMASCASPEERSAANKAADSATVSAPAPAAADTNATAATEEAATPAETETQAKAAAPVQETPPPAPAAAPKEDHSKGEALLAKSDCLACHNKTQKLVGPAYVNVAAKYPATDENINHLVDKVISGGQGVWGAIPMTPHPTLSKDDAKEMVKYILSLKK